MLEERERVANAEEKRRVSRKKEVLREEGEDVLVGSAGRA